MSKPPIPYVKDWKFKVHSHIPPPPSDNQFKYCQWLDSCRNSSRRTEESERYINPVERCLLCPPQEGTTGSFNVYLKIIKLLTANEAKNTPIAIVEVLQTSSPLSSQGRALTPGKRLLAKIYDPLYGRDEDDDDSPFSFANQHYINEVAVYEKLSDLQGVRIPRCYGSFTFDLPVDPAYLSKKIENPTRSVRLLLLEYMYRRPMDGFTNPKEQFSQADRKQIVKEIIEFDTIMFARDVKNRDLRPRNVILDYTTEIIKAERSKKRYHLKSVAVIDFGHIKLREKDSKIISDITYHHCFGSMSLIPAKSTTLKIGLTGTGSHGLKRNFLIQRIR